MFLVLFSYGTPVFSKDLPRLVTISEASHHDRERISVFAWVRSIEQKRGRMGSNYLEITLGEGESEIKAYSIFPVYNVLNRWVIVQGIYQQEGRFGGFLASNFIHADAIVTLWGREGER